MQSYNPYAPPQNDGDPAAAAPAVKKRGRASAAVQEALDRLNEHLADDAAVAADRALFGPPIRTATWVALGLGAVGLLAVAAGLAEGGEDMEIAAIIGGVVAFLGVLVFVILLVQDVKLPKRDQPSDAPGALSGYFRALRFGRFGYAVACLSPTAREATVDAPRLEPVDTGTGSFRLSTTDGMKAYTATFSRPSKASLHIMSVKKVELARASGDVAEVDVEIEFQSWPRWAYIVAVVAFVVVRILGVVVGLALYFALRKVKKTRIRKTMLRGSTGAWYLHDGDITEGIEG